MGRFPKRPKDRERPYLMIDGPYLDAVDVDLEKWCEKYELHSFDGECSDCEASLPVNIPFYGPNGVRGLRAELCGCGSTSSPHTLVSIDKEHWLNTHVFPKER